jgi:hypothetical protein
MRGKGEDSPQGDGQGQPILVSQSLLKGTAGQFGLWWSQN